ncbi:glycoside hydrolase family 57 [Planctomycetota bacterium]
MTGESGAPLRLFTVFHLNLAFSSIEEDQREEVVTKCYWPLLNLARARDRKIGIEASGYTLETIAALDSVWVEELRRLCADGWCEFVGSGYAQLVGPLVPHEVNRANQALGQEVYESHLCRRPTVALVNEQAYSASLIPVYVEAGYGSIVMEWENASRFQPDWKPHWRNRPQRAIGPAETKIPVIWNSSIAFQQFQRYVHCDQDLDRFLQFLGANRGPGRHCMCLYGNDVEVFDFRPGRFDTEPLPVEEEWVRIEQLYEALETDERFRLVAPSQTLEWLGAESANHALRLETPEQPIPVKKQEKYNIVRWAVSGRDDLGVNTDCWRIYDSLRKRGDWKTDPVAWRELCYLWSSDFRTHITEKRWQAYRRRLLSFSGELGIERPAATLVRSVDPQAATRGAPSAPAELTKGRWLSIETPTVWARLDCRRGLAFEAVQFEGFGSTPLFGTLRHGRFDDIAWGADFYSGHLILESPGRAKITDLNPCEPSVDDRSDRIVVLGKVDTPLGPVWKRLTFFKRSPRVDLDVIHEWDEVPQGALRLGHVTLFPEAFDPATLYFASHAGGPWPERFALSGRNVSHGAPVSFLVSASHALGLTEGHVELGDARKCLRIVVDKAVSSPIGLITHQCVDDSYFCRLAFSLRELDDTSRVSAAGDSTAAAHLSLSVTAGLAPQATLGAT